MVPGDLDGEEMVGGVVGLGEDAELSWDKVAGRGGRGL